MTNIISNYEIARRFYEQRNQKLADNISNADNPKAKAQDLKLDFSKLVTDNHSVNMNITRANHISVGTKNITFKNIFRNGEKNINRNDIDLKVETEYLTSNASDANLTADIYKEIWKLIKLAIGNS